MINGLHTKLVYILLGEESIPFKVFSIFNISGEEISCSFYCGVHGSLMLSLGPKVQETLSEFLACAIVLSRMRRSLGSDHWALTTKRSSSAIPQLR